MPNAITEEFGLSCVALSLHKGVGAGEISASRSSQRALWGKSGPDLEEGEEHIQMLQVTLLTPTPLSTANTFSHSQPTSPLTHASKTFSN